MDPEKMLEENPGSVVFPRYADHLAREGRIDEAVDVLKKGIRANPFLAPGYAVLADILFRLESEEEAVENLMTAIKIDPQRPRDLFRLGEYFREHDHEKAETFLRAANTYEPEAVVTSPEEPFEEREESFGRAETVVWSEPSDEPLPGETVPEIIPEGYTPPVETGPREFFDQPIVQEIEEEGNSYSVIGEYGSEHAGKDLETLFTLLGGEEVPEGPLPAGAAGIEETPEDEDRLFGGVAGESADSPYHVPVGDEGEVEFGVVDDERKDSGNEKILEIKEEEEYDLSRYGFGFSGEEDIPVLTEEERSELLSLSFSGESEAESAGHSDFEERPERGVSDLSDTGTGEEHEDEKGAPSPAADLFGRLSSEEIEVLSTVDRESTRREDDLEEEAREGIDYSDVLSQWMPSGETAGVPPREIELFEEEIGSLEENLADVLEAGAPLKPEDVRAGMGEVGAGGVEAEAAQPAPVEGREEFFSAIGEPLELTDEEAALIRDFVSGKEQEPVQGKPVFTPADEVTEIEEFPAAAEETEQVPAWEIETPTVEESEPVGIMFPSAEPEAEEPIEGFAFPVSMPAEGIDALAADYAGSVSGVSEIVFGGESLDDLIAAYARVLESAPKSLLAAEASPKKISSFPPADAGPESDSPLPAPRHAEGYTATMAEIFVSQRLISRAMEIYAVLAGRDPENETFRNRLAELKNLFDQHPDV